MTVLDFVSRYLGQYVTAPGGAGNQCVDLANEYLIEALGRAKVWANAVDWQRAQIKGMKWVNNLPNNAPKQGSLVVWGPYAPLAIGPFGHIALVLAADRMHLVTADQNYPDGSPVNLQLHTYDGVLGWQEPS